MHEGGQESWQAGTYIHHSPRIRVRVLTAEQRFARVVPPRGERAVVFSWFKSGLDVLEAALRTRSMSVARLDGDDGKEERNQVVDAFQREDGARVLLATKASRLA